MAYPDTMLEAVMDAAVQQLPPMRQLDRWWRTRSRRVKTLYYVAWIISMIIAAWHAQSISERAK